MSYLKILFILLLSVYAFGQKTKYDKDYLQSQNRKLQNEISELNKVLAQNKKQSKTSLVYIVNLDNKIKKRQEYLNNTQKEKRFIEDDIYLKQLQINKYKRELVELRRNYGEVLVKAYKNKSVQNKLLFVLTSKDFGQAYRRVKYLQLYSEYQDKKADEIRDKIAQIELLKTSREKDIKEKDALLQQQRVEIVKLDAEREEKEKLVQEFKQNEGKIRAQIKQKQIAQNQLTAQIELAIQEELEIARKKEEERQRKLKEERERLAKIEAERKRKEAEAAALAAASTKAPKPTVKAEVPVKTAAPTETPKSADIPKSDYATLSSNFEANRGNLPNPLPSSTIISPFGKSKHPVLDIMIDNKGIDLASNSSTSIAKAVFNGTVSRVTKISGLYAVMIQHGDYFTVYVNLDDVYVKQGQTIKTGQDIGHVFLNENNQAVLKFIVYQGKYPQNPANWIR